MKHDFRPVKSLGQHFLIDKKVLGKIIQAADLSKNDLVLEIGPGLGVLTKELAKRVKKVIAVEKDKRMVERLKEILKDYRNVEIITGDILKLQGLSFLPRPYKDAVKRTGLSAAPFKVVANLPYYIASPVIRMFLEAKNPPKVMVLMIQKEVAQRISSRPPKMSLLAAAVQFYSQPKIIGYVSKKSFWPRPKVDATIIKINPYPRAALDSTQFFNLVKAGFLSPRKQLVNNLSKGLKIEKEIIKKALLACGLNPEIRAEGLSVKDWVRLVEKLPRPNFARHSKAACFAQ